MAENTIQETYQPCFQVIQEIAKEQGLDMGLIELIMDEISEELRAHPALKFMSDAQQECWLDFRLWCSLFPEKQSDFPGDKAPLEEYEKETTDRRMAELVALRASKNKTIVASTLGTVESTPDSSGISLSKDDSDITVLTSQVSDISLKEDTWAEKVGEPASAISKKDIILQRFNDDLDVRILAAKIAHGEKNLKNVYSHRPKEHPLSQEERTKALTIISELQPMRGGQYVYSVLLPADPETRKRFTEGGQQSLSKASEMLNVVIRSDYRPNVRHFIYPWPIEYNVLKDKEAAAADLIFAYNVLVFWEYSMRNDKVNHITVERAAELMRSKSSMTVTAWLMATNRSDPRIAARKPSSVVLSISSSPSGSITKWVSKPEEGKASSSKLVNKPEEGEESSSKLVIKPGEGAALAAEFSAFSKFKGGIILKNKTKPTISGPGGSLAPLEAHKKMLAKRLERFEPEAPSTTAPEETAPDTSAPVVQQAAEHVPLEKESTTKVSTDSAVVDEIPEVRTESLTPKPADLLPTESVSPKEESAVTAPTEQAAEEDIVEVDQESSTPESLGPKDKGTSTEASQESDSKPILDVVLYKRPSWGLE